MTCYTADIATFDILFPELGSVPDATVQFYLDKSDCVLSFPNWGDTKPEAQLYYSAHMVAVSQLRQAETQISPSGHVVTTGAAGAITSGSSAQISIGFAPSATSSQGSDADIPFTMTSYGQWYLYLKRARMPLGILAGGC